MGWRKSLRYEIWYGCKSKGKWIVKWLNGCCVVLKLFGHVIIMNEDAFVKRMYVSRSEREGVRVTTGEMD